jgi:hypothetical protein
MPTNNKPKRKQAAAKQKQQQQVKVKDKPFSKAGAIVGAKLGSMFNVPHMKGIGRWLGSGIGQIFGSGDYTTVGPQPSYNVLTNGSQIPKFDSTRATNIVCHREYLGDITGTTGFNNTTYPLNPGMPTTFPWLSTIAQNYQEYQFHGLVFEFRPLITDFVTNGAPGVVVMATNYNADVPNYISKQEMENSEFAVSVKPTVGLMHGVECARDAKVLYKQYVRSGAVPNGQDLRLYDLGNFQFATQQNPAQDLGELWVTYCVEFSKPILPSDVGGDVQSLFAERSVVSSAVPFGNIQTGIVGDMIGGSLTGTTLSWYGQPGNIYVMTTSWIGTTAAVATFPNGSSFGVLPYNVGTARAQNYVNAPQIGLTGTLSMTQIMYWKCNLPNPGICTVTYNGSGVFPSGTTTCQVMLTQISTSIV